MIRFSLDDLTQSGLKDGQIQSLSKILSSSILSREKWETISKTILTPDIPFEVHEVLFKAAFRSDESKFIWYPSMSDVAGSNVGKYMAEKGYSSYEDFRIWSTKNRPEFWSDVVNRLNIKFSVPPLCSIDTSGVGVEAPVYLKGAKMNIVDSCFQAPKNSTAIIYQKQGSAELCRMSVGELESLTNRVASGLTNLGFPKGAAIGIDMVMTAESVAVYLGIIKAGMVVVGIADSFSPSEIDVRLSIARAQLVFTHDVIARGERTLPLYARVKEADAARCVVLPENGRTLVEPLRKGDISWNDFLTNTTHDFESVIMDAMDPSNILFSSGTTGRPKAIPWTHASPIKSAMDAHFHHDIRPGEVVAWPTSLGWMMGPWLVYAALLNRATMALFYGGPGTRSFCEFVERAQINMLGVVPSLVKAWKKADSCSGLNWKCVRRFSSTGEASAPDLYHWLMSRAHYAPVVEYCGGTEIAGGYISGNVVQPQLLSSFSSISLGLDLVLLDENGLPSDDGEVAIIPPSVGLSTCLLEQDHSKVYFSGMPPGPNGEVLRRHGDHMKRLPNGYYQARGRIDDTMNLGGIKVSSVQLERACSSDPSVSEAACIAHNPPQGGPSQLVVVVTLSEDSADRSPEALAALKKAMQRAISTRINPLFRVADVMVVGALPRTASGKVMRRVLRREYADKHGGRWRPVAKL
eukprot:138142_1